MSEPLTKNEKLTLWVSGVSGLIALLAILVSFWSNQISEDAYQLANRSYTDERRILLKTKYFKENEIFDGIIFSSLEVNSQIAGVTIYFPSKLGIPPIVLTPPDLKLYSSKISNQIKSYLKTRIGVSQGFTTIAPHYPIQVLVITHGYTKGVSVLTLGVYDLLFTFIQGDDGSSNVRLKAGILNNYTNAIGKPQKYIDAIFRQFEAHAAN